ncbi:hypothetical protein C7S20_16505 [Christiangramia fulva]|uniref:Uncharacterized protein n=1 Tax=Christiangramia fulva TaxID=2126553 RepID=A0A2R3Z8Y1_9FLAO|nr:hypothetical protein [Christiangramia fulva]AVR46737.1 hypothetical protein C7S20_16505 [Christiangramia fulva]
MKNSQVLNTILIIIGGACLIYAIAVENTSPFIKIIGLVIIMFGLYRATNHWASTKDDHLDEEKENQQ